jgi:hypothetical protein
MNEEEGGMARTISMPHNWKPRADQWDLWNFLDTGLMNNVRGMRAVEVAHRRFGKDAIALRFISKAAFRVIGTYWYMLPEYSQARKTVWDAINPHTGRNIMTEAFPYAIREDTRQNDMFIRLLGPEGAGSGSTVQLVGSDNYNSIVGSPPIGIVNNEYSIANPRAWGYLEPILEENGGWALFIGTPRGNNHMKRMYDYIKSMSGPNYFAQVLRADQTDVFTADQLKRIKEGMMAEWGETEGSMLFDQEYMCSFQGVVPGAYFARQMADARAEGRITSVSWVPNHEVYTMWDLGVDDSMTIWFVQIINTQFRFIDYYENSGMGLAHYAKVLKEKPYVYGDHYMPHDAAVREMSSGEVAESRKKVAEGLGIKPIIVVKRPRDITAVNSGIEAARNLIPQCWFDGKKCWQGLSGLEGYMAEYDEVKKKLGNRPVHDWCSHASDAFRTFAVGFKVRKKKPDTKTVSSIMDSTPAPGLM